MFICTASGEANHCCAGKGRVYNDSMSVAGGQFKGYNAALSQKACLA